MTVRIVFMGSPDFALPTLAALEKYYSVVGVVTQPDRPAGRGRVLTPPPVKQLAMQLGIEVIQPLKLREPEAQQKLAAWAPDVIIVAAFGQILRKPVLELAPHGCVNVHASLLPRWRGAAPIQAAILAGDAETGVTIMRMDAGIDTGAILRQRATSILDQDTAGSLSDRLADDGAKLLIETLPDYLAGKITPQPQDETRSTYASMLAKEQGQLDFSRPAIELERQVRAFIPWPGAYTFFQGELLKVLRAHVDAGPSIPGQRAVRSQLPAIGAADGWLVLDEVQPAGKRPMPGSGFLHGARQWESQA
ncbi:methionyl-tRNA formyltransferase [Longilinea arvoryzae]|uniref:Methionyl-tRNA formyltransferase n=1 Tax=Longilinea arvoryzae TaxID=360412 RepID=A0A0S7BKT5_9CHLR|nr:methionyl-tRNA formyltransferase [Longilinea arvoryzae]GAP14449.1 methionyl-tRNA formyltransferase [Longilinea arvoryzae]